jgi:carboxyl-terminal processing protease
MLKNLFLLSLFFLFLGGCKEKQKLSVEQPYWGTWQSSGYGYILDIVDGDFALYDIDSKYCVRQAANSSEIAQLLPHFEAFSNAKIGLSQSAASKLYYFNRLDQLPNQCKQKMENSPQVVVDQFATMMQEHYAFFDLHRVNWQKRVEQAKSKVTAETSDRELFEILSEMMVGLNDGHLYINAKLNGNPEQINYGDSKVLKRNLDKAFSQQSKIETRKQFGKEWYKGTLANVDELLNGETNYIANNQIIWGNVNNIGYIKIRNMYGFVEDGTLSEEIDAVNNTMAKILIELGEKPIIVIDLTTNSGGNDEAGRAITNHFTDKRLKLYSHSTLGSTEASHEYFTKPSKSPYLGKVLVYTSDHTVSAAETFTMGMKALPNVTHVGTTTRGALSDILDKTLVNGWEVGLSNMTYLDSDDTLWEGIGIPPEVELKVFNNENIFTSHLVTTRRLFKMIEAGQFVKN